MKTYILSLFLLVSLFCSAHEGGNFVASDMLAGMQPGDKAALLMVHFGTTYDDTRTKTIDEIRDVLYEQEERRIWRVLAWNLKARMVAVDEQVETFEEAFLAHLLDPQTNRTIFEQLADTGTVQLAQPLLALTAGDSA